MKIPNRYLLAFTTMVSLSINAFAADESGSESDFVPAKIATALTHSCVLSTKGQVKCWGSNITGELGLESRMSHGHQPATMGPNLPRVNFGSNLYAKDVCVASHSTCVATTDGRVKCWGQNDNGRLGQERDVFGVGTETNDMGNNLPFTDLGSDFKVKSVHCGTGTTCALSDTGKLKCWGAGKAGQLGPNIAPKTSIGSLKGEMGSSLPSVSLPVKVSYVSIGLGSTCAASKSDVYCWGVNGGGQAGIGSSEPRIYLPADPAKAKKVKLEDDGIATVIEGISSGMFHNCAVYHLTDRTEDQKVKCWGENHDGALGIGSTVPRMGSTPDTLGAKLPQTKLALSQIIQLEAHEDFTCALTKNGMAKCWGINKVGALGVGDEKSRGQSADHMGAKLPRIDLGLQIHSLSSSSYAKSSCAILINHEIKCWGFAGYGTLGYEDNMNRGLLSDDMGENLPYVRYK